MTAEKHITMWAYPWDIKDEGIEKTVKFAKSNLGLTSLNVTAIYHSGKFLLPRNPRRRVYFPEPGATYFPPTPQLYKGLKLQPFVSSLAQEEDLYLRIREACHKEALNFEAWVLAFHNSGLGWRYPECCQRNAYGDIYPYALCPTNPHCQEFVKALVTDLMTNYEPYAVDLESPNYVGYLHGMHHELTPTNYGDLEVFLLSLCFCDNCRKMAEEAGIEIDNLQRWVRETLDRRLNEDWFSPEWVKKNMEDLYGLLMYKPDLMEFIRARQRVVTSIVRDLKEICRKGGAKLFTIASIFSRPSNRAWTEGTDLPKLAELVDGLGILCYYPTPTEVFDDLRFAASVVPDKEKLMVGLMAAMPTASSKEVLLGQVSAAKALGISKFGFYNYGFINDLRLPWVAEAVRLVKS